VPAIVALVEARIAAGGADAANLAASDAERQRLLPFVTRLACADTPAIELERAAYIRSKVATAHSFEYGLKVLEGALAIGWQADTLGFDEASAPAC